MRLPIKPLATALALGSVLVFSACAETHTSESTGQYLDDTGITSKVKAKILQDDDLKVLQIGVSTYKGVVQLSGFVDNAAMKARATQVVRTVEGVESVENDLVVKPRP